MPVTQKMSGRKSFNCPCPAPAGGVKLKVLMLFASAGEAKAFAMASLTAKVCQRVSMSSTTQSASTS
jgi:hypothetical protein